jgi:hypothetical protein
MSSRIGAARGVATVVILVSACGGAGPQRPAEAPPSGRATEESAPATGGAPGAGYPASAAPEQPSGSTDLSSVEAAGQAPGPQGQARQELARAEAQLEAARSDCAAACRALASMQRATEHLCALADESDDRRRCEEARKRLLAARDRVRSSCGGCP